jgi:hypothetical protein
VLSGELQAGLEVGIQHVGPPFSLSKVRLAGRVPVELRSSGDFRGLRPNGDRDTVVKFRGRRNEWNFEYLDH